MTQFKLQNLESAILSHLNERYYGGELYDDVVDQTQEDVILLLGHRQLSLLYPEIAEQFLEADLLYDGMPGFSEKAYALLNNPPENLKIIFANFHIGGIHESPEFQLIAPYPHLHSKIEMPMQNLMSFVLKGNAKQWLQAACDQEFKKKISYVVLSGFDNATSLTEMLASFVAHTEPKDDNELIVVLNGYSSFPDQAIQQAVNRGFSVKIIYRNLNIGVGLGFAEGVRVANGEYICILQDDVLFSQSNWDRELAGYLDQYHEIGIIGGFRADYLFRNTPSPVPSALDQPYQHIASALIGSCDWELMKQAVVEVDLTLSMCMMIRRHLSDFDWHFAPTDLEDMALCFEARQKGFSVYATDIGINHGKIESVVRNKTPSTLNWAKELGRPLMRGFHYQYFMERYGKLVRPFEMLQALNVTTIDDMTPHIKTLPRSLFDTDEEILVAHID